MVSRLFSEENEFVDASDEFKKFSRELRDPVVVGALLHKLTEERSSTNFLLKEIDRKLEKIAFLEEKVKRLEAEFGGKNVLPNAPAPPDFLPEIDEEIFCFVKKKMRVTAADVQKKFKYKGRNAASARLNGLFKQGLLSKKQVGRRVFFYLNPASFKKSMDFNPPT